MEIQSNLTTEQLERAFYFTASAWECALMYHKYPVTRNYTVKERCCCCGKLRGLGFVKLEEDGTAICLFCADVESTTS